MTDSSALEAVLAGYEHWRNIGNDILIGGLIAEVFISAVLEKWSHKRWLDVAAAVVVAAGVWIEVQNGAYADDTSRKLRAELNQGVADANTRTAEAERATQEAKRDVARLNKEAAETFRLIAPRQVPWTNDAKAFARFPGTRVVVRYERDEDRCEDCRTFATSFTILNTSEIGWKVVSWIGVDRRMWNPSMGAGQIGSGVTILSRRPSWWNDPGQATWSAPPPEPPGGYSVRDRTWAAGYALIEYLRKTTGVEADHAFLDLGGSVDASGVGGDNLDLGEDTMVVEIGKRSIEQDTLQRMLDERTGHALSGEK